jgi:hypothetical protein
MFEEFTFLKRFPRKYPGLSVPEPQGRAFSSLFLDLLDFNLISLGILGNSVRHFPIPSYKSLII